MTKIVRYEVSQPITNIHDFRVPLPELDGTTERPGSERVSPEVREAVAALLRERNTCTDARVDEIDAEILRRLAPWTLES